MALHEQILQKAVDEACARDADIVHDPNRTARWAPQDARIWMRLNHDDRGRVTLERLRHWSEGYASYGRTVDLLKPDGMKRFRQLVEDEVSLIARLQRRDAEALARRGTRYEPCPSALTCHPVGLAIAVHAGYPAADICSADLERVHPGWRAVQDGYDAMSRASPDRGNDHRVRIRGETVVFRDMALPRMRYGDHTPEGPVLTVACDLPETALAIVANMTLDRVVEHPALDGLPLIGIRKTVRTRMGDRPAIAIHLRRMKAPFPAKDTAA